MNAFARELMPTAPMSMTPEEGPVPMPTAPMPMVPMAMAASAAVPALKSIGVAPVALKPRSGAGPSARRAAELRDWIVVPQNPFPPTLPSAGPSERAGGTPAAPGGRAASGVTPATPSPAPPSPSNAPQPPLVPTSQQGFPPTFPGGRIPTVVLPSPAAGSAAPGDPKAPATTPKSASPPPGRSVASMPGPIQPLGAAVPTPFHSQATVLDAPAAAQNNVSALERAATELAVDGPIGPRCSTCGAPLVPGSSRCEACRTAVGEASRCPHCRAIADVTPSAKLRFVCMVCGRPRVPTDGLSLPRSFPEAEALQQAGRDSTAATAWRVAAIAASVVGVFLLCVLGIVAAVLDAGPMIAALAVITAVASFGLTALAVARSRARRAGANRALEAGWGQAALELARLWGGIDARSFARTTRIHEADAERLLSRVSAASQLTGSIADDGALRYKLLETSHYASSPYERPYAPNKR